MNKDPFKEYIKESEPTKRDKSYAWHTAIGLQAVDGLKTWRRRNYNDLKNGIHETTEYLEVFLRNLLLNENHPLHNRALHISGTFEKAAKPDIEVEEPDIENMFQPKTAGHILRLREAFPGQAVFGRSDVMKVIDIKSSRASDILKEMAERRIIEPVAGHGKGKYRFRQSWFRLLLRIINSSVLAFEPLPEEPLYAPDGTMFLPDFTVIFRGEAYYWEHVGRLDLPVYRVHWEAKYFAVFLEGDTQMMIGEERIREILEKPTLKEGLQSYIFIMERLHQTNVSVDGDFQSAFRRFYQMKRFYGDEFARHYFNLMEQMKDSRELSFAMVLERVKHIQNTYEMSFSSKMVHTINPLHPIWDSVVTRKHFGISAPYVKKDREAACCKRYAAYEDQFYDFMSSEEGMMIVHLFDEHFPEAGISDVKKIDFVLWQDR